MMLQILYVAHVAVLGYWLGSEFVINSTYRHVVWSTAMPFAERDRLMDHVMTADQHVRYALILQAGLGTALVALYGLTPGGETLAWTAGVLSGLWLVLAEVTHHLRGTQMGQGLARIDRVVRYLAILLLVGLAAAAAMGQFSMPAWLAWKLVCFAGVIACGLVIRITLIDFYRTWRVIERDGSDDDREKAIRRAYLEGTGVLLLLWVFIAAAVALSIYKP